MMSKQLLKGADLLANSSSHYERILLDALSGWIARSAPLQDMRGY